MRNDIRKEAMINGITYTFQADAISEQQLDLLNGMVRFFQSQQRRAANLLSRDRWNFVRPQWRWHVFGSRNLNEPLTFDVRFAHKIPSTSAPVSNSNRNRNGNSSTTGTSTASTHRLADTTLTSHHLNSQRNQPNTARRLTAGTQTSSAHHSNSQRNRTNAINTPTRHLTGSLAVANIQNIRPSRNALLSTPTPIMSTPRSINSNTSTPTSFRRTPANFRTPSRQ